MLRVDATRAERPAYAKEAGDESGAIRMNGR